MSAQEEVKVDDVVICLIDEYRSGKKSVFDCHVQIINNKGIDVLYLSGYRSRNDFVPWDDVVARLDKSQPYKSLEGYGFTGHFKCYKTKGEEQS